MTLGSLIRSYKYRYRKSRGSKQTSSAEKHQILQVIQRLEDYKKYQKEVKNKRKTNKRNAEKKAITRIKRDSYKKAYWSKKPIHNPYIYMYEKHSIAVDPRLEQKYNSRPIYCFYEFRHLHLPKSDYEIKAGPAWGALIKSWKGYKISKREHNATNMKLYAYTTQKWADMLELPLVPDFRCASIESFYNSKKLRTIR